MQLGENSTVNQFLDAQEAADIQEAQFEEAADEKQRDGEFVAIAERRVMESVIHERDPHDVLDSLLLDSPMVMVRALFVMAGRRDLLPVGYAENLGVLDEGKAVDMVAEILREQEKLAREEWIQRQRELEAT